MTPQQFLEKWTTRRELFQENRASVDGAALCDAVISDFGAVRRTEAELQLSIQEAAAHVNRSPETIAKAIRQGAIPNAGRKGKPRVRLGDLIARYPVKHVATGGTRAYDVGADARFLLGARRGGN